VKSGIELLKLSKKLAKENKELQRQLQAAREYIDIIKGSKIDALVIADKKALKIYTEKSADKPYRVLIEKMHEGAVALNENGIIIYCNSHFANMVKLPLQNVIGINLGLFIDLTKERFESLFRQDSKNDISEEICIYTSEGTTIPALMSANTLALNDHLITGIILTDLTTQNKNQEELKQRTKQLEQKNIELENANKDLTSFTFVSSHDLQEPLRKIQNFVTCIFLEEENNLSETGKGYFHKLNDTAKRMQSLIEDLLTYSRAKSHERNFERTNLNILFEEVRKDFEDVMPEKRAIIEIDCPYEVDIIRFQFRQLMHNLISNSLKFSKLQTRPHITIDGKIVNGGLLQSEKLSSKIDYCHLTYRDNGIGFDPQYRERIFEVFQRLHSQSAYEGTGIGLAICKRIVEAHGGIITALGVPNKGAEFNIYFPISSLL
jgi:PAS domain S-box-containing protein